MKKVVAVVVGILFVGGIVIGLSTSVAVAGPHGHHHGHWGYGPAFIAGGSSTVVTEECPLVKRCWINSYGEKRCKWVQECD